MNGTAIGVDGSASLEDATVAFADAGSIWSAGYGDFFEHLSHRVSRSRGFGDFWGHMLVARGAAHVMIETELRTWDIAPLDPIVHEAGGRMTTLSGDHLSDKGSCLTTNGALHEIVLELVTEFG